MIPSGFEFSSVSGYVCPIHIYLVDEKGSVLVGLWPRYQLGRWYSGAGLLVRLVEGIQAVSSTGREIENQLWEAPLSTFRLKTITERNSSRYMNQPFPPLLVYSRF